MQLRHSSFVHWIEQNDLQRKDTGGAYIGHRPLSKLILVLFNESCTVSFINLVALVYLVYKSNLAKDWLRHRVKPRAEKNKMEDTKYLPELLAEKDSLDSSFTHAMKLISAGKVNMIAC